MMSLPVEAPSVDETSSEDRDITAMATEKIKRFQNFIQELYLKKVHIFMRHPVCKKYSPAKNVGVYEEVGLI